MVRFWKVTSITANKLGSNPLSSKYFNFALIFEMVRNNVCKKYLNTISHRSVFYFFSFLILIVPGWFLPTKKLEKLEGKKYHAYFFSIFFFVNSSSTFLYTQGHHSYTYIKRSPTHTYFFPFCKNFHCYWNILDWLYDSPPQ